MRNSDSIPVDALRSAAAVTLQKSIARAASTRPTPVIATRDRLPRGDVLRLFSLCSLNPFPFP
ncbi:MAG: hypothetical protein AAGG51_12605 [Cyanobacteria bacterium P01_G01_bin.54]